MNGGLADALQDCLERIEAGGSIEAAVARHPAHAADLGGLVRAALLVRAHRPAAATAFRARLQVALVNADLAAPPAAAAARAPVTGSVWRAMALRLAGMCAAVVLLLGGVVVASANSRPGDVLYPVRRGVEHLRDAAAHALAPGRVEVAHVAATGAAPAAPTAAHDRRTAPNAPDAVEVGSAGGGDGAAEAPDTARVDRPRPSSEGERRTGSGGAPGIVAGATAPPTDAPAATATDAPTIAPTATAADHRPQPPARAADPGPAEPRVTIAATVVEPTAEPAPYVPVPLPHVPPVVIEGRGGMAGRVIVEGDDDDRVLVSAYPVAASGDLMWWRRKDAWTGRDGRFRFENLAVGTYKVKITYGHRGSQSRWFPNASRSSDAEPVVVRAGEVREGIDIRVERPRRLELPGIWPPIEPPVEPPGAGG